MGVTGCTIESGCALIQIGPTGDGGDDVDVLRGLWRTLQDRSDVDALIVHFSGAAALEDDGAQLGGPIGPKSNGLIKSVAAAIDGPARNEVLQVVAEADLVVATPESTFAETSVADGENVVHVQALAALLPRAELLRMSLAGPAGVMSSERAEQLHLVDAVVAAEELLIETKRRLDQLRSP